MNENAPILSACLNKTMTSAMITLSISFCWMADAICLFQDNYVRCLIALSVSWQVCARRLSRLSSQTNSIIFDTQRKRQQWLAQSPIKWRGEQAEKVSERLAARVAETCVTCRQLPELPRVVAAHNYCLLTGLKGAVKNNIVSLWVAVNKNF